MKQMGKTLSPNTHTDEELMSPEFRARVEKLKISFRMATIAHNPDIGTYWTALHEPAKEILLSNKGEEQAEMYWDKLLEFSEWQFAQEEEFEGERA